MRWDALGCADLFFYFQKAKAVKSELKEAKQYRETRAKAKADGRAVPDARPVYQQKAKVSADTQRMLRNQVSM